jgi:Sec-independent protein translocase protein TatA
MDNPTNGAEQAAREFGQDVKEFRREVRQRAEDVKREAVRQLNTRAEAIRKEAREAGLEPAAIAQMDEMAAGIEKAASYLNNRSLEQMGQDIDRTIDENTGRVLVITLLIGFVLGFLLRGGRR